MDKMMSEQRILEITKKCALAHKKFQDSLKGAQACMDEAKALFQFCMKWLRATKSIKDEMDSIESQKDKDSSAYDLAQGLDGSIRSMIDDLHEKYFQLEGQQEKIIMQFGNIRDLVNSKFTSISSALESDEKATKINLVPSTPEEQENSLMELETL